MTNKINIFFTINNAYCKYLAVTMSSILLNTTQFVNFYIIDGGISDNNKQKINELKKIKDFNIEYLPIDVTLFNKMPSSSQAHISNETNYRFLISSIKPEIDKCIFLDADLVVDGDISELWNIDIKDYYMAAVNDQAALNIEGWAKKLPLPADYTYVNTGVTVMNLKKWRKDNVEKQFFENVSKYKDLLMFPDQDILNITLFSKVKYLSHIFNAMPVQKYRNLEQEKEAFSHPIIIHWAGGRKPWLFPDVPYSFVFWKYARQTPFYEEIIYQNAKSNYALLNASTVKDAFNFTKNKIRYWRYKLLSKITLGNMRKHYKSKKKDLKKRLKQVKAFLKGK